MSIYIPGMTMPNDGREWIMFLRVITRKVELFDPIGEDESVFFEAVELPPHGRLIDADAMEKTMSDAVQGNIREYSYSDTLWEMAFKWIDHQPTIIPAEEA